MKNEYYDSDEFKELLDQYNKSLAEGGVSYLDADDFCDLADYFLTSTNSDQALACVDTALDMHPGYAPLIYIKAGALIFVHRYQEARELLATTDNTAQEAVYMNAQLAYAIDHDIDRAEELFTQWLVEERDTVTREEEDEHYREEYIRDTYIHIITSFIELTENHKYDEELVKRWIEDYLISFSPLGNYDSDLILADVVREECMFDMVVKVYSSILETNPYINYGWTVLAAAQYYCESYDEAIESADFALAINPEDWDSVLTKAHSLYATNRRTEALPYFETYLAHVDDENQYLGCAICLICAERPAEAVEYLRKAEHHYEKNRRDKEYYTTGLFEMADAYLACEEYESAGRLIDKACAIKPDNPDFILLKATVMLSRTQFKDAISLFIKYIEANEDIVFATVNVCLRLMLFDQDAVAAEMITTVEDFAEEHPELNVSSLYPYKAMACLKCGQTDDFMDYLKRSQQQCPDILRKVMGHLFPDNMPPRDYYDYVLKSPHLPDGYGKKG